MKPLEPNPKLNNVYLVRYLTIRSFFVEEGQLALRDEDVLEKSLFLRESLEADNLKQEERDSLLSIKHNLDMGFQARADLIDNNLHLVEEIASKYSDNSSAYAWGVEGLVRACDTYQFSRSITFEAYAKVKIRCIMSNGMRSTVPMIPLTANLETQCAPIYDLYKSLCAERGQVSIVEVAKEFIKDSPVLDESCLDNIVRFAKECLDLKRDVVSLDDIDLSECPIKEPIVVSEYVQEKIKLIMPLLTLKGRMIIDALYGLTYYPQKATDVAFELGLEIDEVLDTQGLAFDLLRSDFLPMLLSR